MSDGGQHTASARLLWTFTSALSGVHDELERARLTATGLPSLLSCHMSGVALIDDKGAAWNLIAQKDGQSISLPLTKQFVAELDALFAETLRGPSLLTERVPPFIRNFGVRNLAVVPLRTLNRQMGMVFVGRETLEPFSSEEEQTLLMLAEHSSIAMENLRLSNNLQNLVEERTEKLRKAEERHRVLLEVNNAVIANLDKESLLQAIADTLHKGLPFDRATLTLRDPETDILTVHALSSTTFGKRFLTVGTEFPMMGSPLASVFQKKKALIRHHLENGQRVGIEESLYQEGIRSYISVPLMAKREPIASLNLGSRAPEEYSPEVAEFLMEIGQQMALAVENMLAYEEITQLKSRLERENLNLVEEIKVYHKFEEITGRDRATKKLLSAVETVAPTDATVLILGETGTGKELVARAIHKLSSLKDHTLVNVNCAALPSGLIESELFGHERGAFTGALARKPGRFELADGGTIFLDEIGDLPLELQAKLLRVLQEGEFERVGGSRTIRVRVRVIAATNRDLVRSMEEGTFREDLYYRLNVFPLQVPPLRERKGDISLLVRHFALKYGERFGKRIESIQQHQIEALHAYDWPGNIRELENVIERAMILSQGPELSLGDWAPGIRKTSPSSELSTLQEVEREHILRVLKLTNWRLSGEKGAARILGLNRTTLQGRMRKLQILRRED